MKDFKAAVIRFFDDLPEDIKKEIKGVKQEFKVFSDFKTFDDCCRYAGTTEVEFEAKYNELPISQTLKTIAKLEIVSNALNQGWMQDTLNTKEKKWAPYFSVSSSGLGFSYSTYNSDLANAHVGFPFCFESEEKSNHAGRQFIKLWEELLLRKID